LPSLPLIANLSNAIKFSHFGGEVEVYLGGSESGIVCESGTGVSGVSEAFSEQLFERFAQEMSGTRRDSGGSGLGLFICRGIIDLHGGRIGYRAREGGGSVFHFEIPET
jgi:signal transduction histidine kinase